MLSSRKGPLINTTGHYMPNVCERSWAGATGTRSANSTGEGGFRDLAGAKELASLDTTSNSGCCTAACYNLIPNHVYFAAYLGNVG
jgi:hypothetical protein